MSSNCSGALAIDVLFSVYIMFPVNSLTAGLVNDAIVAVFPETLPVIVSPTVYVPPVPFVVSRMTRTIPAVRALFVLANCTNLDLAPLVPPVIISSEVRSPESAVMVILLH